MNEHSHLRDGQLRHVPVLLSRCLDLLAPAIATSSTPVVIDATVGMGGHTMAMLERFPTLEVVGIDRDSQALAIAQERTRAFADRVHFVHAVYDDIDAALSGLGIDSIQGALFDLGVSSMQLDEAQRGFAYSQDAPLDMRMDSSSELTAADVLNQYSHQDLVRVLRTYGEEKFAPRIASAIIREREVQPFTTSARLVELIRQSIPAPARRTGGNPAKRTFQALRIEVNAELDVLRRALPAAIEVTAVGGRLVVMSYHSLEDKITKECFNVVTELRAPADLPVVPDYLQPTWVSLTRGAEMASADEIAANPRAGSVRLRAIEHVRAAA